MPDDRIPMTQEEYDRRVVELDQMQSKLQEISKHVAAARELGDLSENAEYHAAREDQGMQQAKINQLRDMLSKAFIVDLATLPKDSVVFGTKVTVKDLDLDEEEVFHLVGGDPDPAKNRILVSSPVGQGLLGKKVGEIAEIPVPSGKLRFEVVAIVPPS